LIGACSYLWCSADFWREHRVRKYLLSNKRFPHYDLPKFNNQELIAALRGTTRTIDPLIVDGPSGAGKSSVIKEFSAILSRVERLEEYCNLVQPSFTGVTKRKYMARPIFASEQPIQK
jgi:hypothetical protein